VSQDMDPVLRAALKSQYHAGLAMLRDAIEKCPEELWVSGEPVNPFWRIAYHALYYTHFYLQADAASFRPWDHHQTGIQYMDDVAPPDRFGNLGELSHRPPRTGEPYTKAQVLDYWSLLDRAIDEAVDALDLGSAESGFFWYRVSKAEHQMINLRHLQHHSAQLGDRIRQALDVGIRWVGAGSAPPKP
jgi:hypothetical protein